MPSQAACFAAALLLAGCGAASERGLLGGSNGGPGVSTPDGGTPDGGPVDGFYRLRPSPVATENQRPGSSAWQCPNYNPDFGAYTHRTSYLPGEAVEVHAALAGGTTSATWQLWRMGYYGGARGRLVASGGPVSIPAQTPIVVDPATGAVSVQWPASLTFTIPADAVTGIYLVKLSSARGETLAPLVVREKTPGAVILYPVSTNTYQAYNTWGGTSLYVNAIGWKPPGWTDPGRPGHAFAVSFDRPYLQGLGSGEFLAKDRDFVTFAEGQGYDIGYATDTDVDADPSLAAHRRMLVIQGHSEYWTRGMRDATEAAIASGTNTVFFAANNAYWQVRFQDAARRLLVGYKQYCALDPVGSTNPALQTCLWREKDVAPISRPENAVIGEQYGAWIWSAAPLQVDDPSSWIWTGAGVDANTTIIGVYGNEIDERFDNGAEPAGVSVVASGLVQSYFGLFDVAHTTLYTAPSGAQVFSAGSITWSKSLAGSGTWDPRIQQLVANLFSKLAGDGTLGPDALKALQMAPGAPRPSYRSGVQVSTVTTRLTQPAAVAAAPDGTLVVADGNRIFRVNASGSDVHVIAGSVDPGNVDGYGANARFDSPRGLAVAKDGTIYVADTNNHRIRTIRSGQVAHLAGSLAGRDGQGFADGVGVNAMFLQPMGIALEANGNLLVADSWNMRLREVTPSGLTRTWAGNGQNAVLNGPGSSASLTYPMAVAVLPGGDALIVEPDIGIIRRVSASATHDVSQYAGPELFSNGSDGWSDGPAWQANVYHTVALAVRPSDGQVLLVDGASARVRAIKGGNVDTLAGGLRGHTADGSGSQAGFGAPRGVAIAPDGSAYVVDAKEHTLRHVAWF